MDLNRFSVKLQMLRNYFQRSEPINTILTVDEVALVLYCKRPLGVCFRKSTTLESIVGHC